MGQSEGVDWDASCEDVDYSGLGFRQVRGDDIDWTIYGLYHMVFFWSEMVVVVVPRAWR